MTKSEQGTNDNYLNVTKKQKKTQRVVPVQSPVCFGNSTIAYVISL